MPCPAWLSTRPWPLVLPPGQPESGLVPVIRPGLYWTMNRRLVVLLFLASAATLLAPEFISGTSRKTKPSSSGDGKDKPRISLTADPTFGFTPVTVVLTGHLTGVDLHDRNFCHAATIWVRIDPGQTERDGFRIREDPACV